MSNKKSFLIYYDNDVVVCRLPDEEAGQLFKSLFPYAKEHLVPDFEYSPALAMAFDILKMAIDRDTEKYKQTCEKNRQNIRKRWYKTNTDEYDRTKSNTNHTDKDKDKDMDKDNIDYQQIVDMYNETCVSFPRLTKLSEARKKAIRARLKNYTVEDFRKLFQMAEESSFLKGGNDRDWSATFDWLLKDSNMAKVLDGNYSDRKPANEDPDDDYESYEESLKIMRGYLGNKSYVPRPDDPFQ